VTNIPSINIPSELLRTLITVVDLRSFTRAAQTLGVTQPAVSAQIKRLQVLLGVELFDKSAPGVSLTEKGELVVNYARRILAMNDHILGLVAPKIPAPILRVGIPGDFAGPVLPRALAQFQARASELRFRLRGDSSENLLRDLRQGELDLAIALTAAGPALDARHFWREEVVWVRGRDTGVESTGPPRVVTMREGGLMHRLTTTILNREARDYDIVFTAFASVGLIAAVSAGLGVALLPRREVTCEIVICDEPYLPRVSDVYCGLYLREGIDCEKLEELADTLASALAPSFGRAPAPAQGIDTASSIPSDAMPVEPLRAGGGSYAPARVPGK
jgi:DNA-binding transcriptional LysR family regulator